MANRFKPKSPPSKQCRLTYKEKRDFLMSNERVKIAFMRQRASPEGETKEQGLVCLSYLTILGRFLKYILVFNFIGGIHFSHCKEKISYIGLW